MALRGQSPRPVKMRVFHLPVPVEQAVVVSRASWSRRMPVLPMA
jgi:hypothetical protein